MIKNDLKEKYPNIIKCGIDCMDGWYWLLDNLCRSLTWDIEKNGYPQVEAVQIKEKFGGLRFYTNGHNELQEGMIRLAESLSYGICEKCGSTTDVKPTKSMWVKSLCPKCMEGDWRESDFQPIIDRGERK